MKDKDYYLYCHTNKINNKKYIGISKQLPIRRWGKHGNGYKGCPKFEKTIKNMKEKLLQNNFSKEKSELLINMGGFI